MQAIWRTSIATLAVLGLALAACAPAAQQPTAAPAAPKPPAAATTAPAKPTAAPAAKAAPSPAPAKAEPKPAEKAAAKPTGAPIKVGFVAPLSGPVASYGAGVKHAPTLVLRETNAAGGINGSPVELVTCDSPNNPNQAITCLQRLANQDKVFAVVGPYYTGEMQAAVPILGDLKLPNVPYTPGASYPGLVQQNQWSTLADTDELATVSMAVEGFKKTYPSVKKVVVVGDVQTAVTALTIKEVWPKVLPEKGYQVLDTITYQFNTTDFGPIATRIKGSGAEGIALSSLSPAAPSLLQELERQGAKLPVVTSSHLQTVPPLPKILGKTADGLIQTMFFSPDELKKASVKEWADKYEAISAADSPGAEKIPVGYANEVQAYDAFNFTMKALKDSGVKPDTAPAEAREKVRQALRNVKGFPGVLRPKEITSNGRFTWDLYPLIAKDGVYVEVK